MYPLDVGHLLRPAFNVESNWPVELDLEELFFHKAMRSEDGSISSQFTGSDMTQATISIDPTIWPESTTSHMKSASRSRTRLDFEAEQGRTSLPRLSTEHISPHAVPDTYTNPKAVKTASSSCGGTGSDTTLDNAHVAKDYLARTTTTYRIIAVGRTCSVP